MLSATKILAIPPNEPERLFHRDTVDQDYHSLAKYWHPDTCKDPDASKATEVFAHLNSLHKTAKDKLKVGNWTVHGLLVLQREDGTEVQIKYAKKRAFELGEMYYGRTIIVYVTKPEYEDLAKNFLKVVTDFKFKDNKMRDEMSRFLPKIKTKFKTKDGHFVIVLEKTPDSYLLRDVLDHAKGKIDPQHIAWITNSIYNIACYLDWAGVTNNDISLDTVFISPEKHMGMLFGGWWYGAKAGEKLTSLSGRTHGYTPPDILRDKKASPRLDLTLIRVVGRELMGDPSGMSLVGVEPKPMVDFLRRPTSGKAVDDYKNWNESALKPSFGKRRFVKLDINPSDIYGE